MTSGLPGQVKGERPQSLAAAQEAARRSGLSIGQWLDSVIAVSSPAANTPYVAGAPTEIQTTPEPDSATATSARSLLVALGRINSRLDEIDARGRDASLALEQHVDSVGRALASLARERAAVAVSGTVATPRVASPPLADWSNSLDTAVAEIARRQRELDDQDQPGEPAVEPPAPPEKYLPPSYRSGGDELAGLGAQLKDLTARIEQIQRPCRAEDAIGPLREDLAEIARTLKDALPRRAIEALEGEVRKLAERLDATRSDNPGAVLGIEKSLNDVRDALRGLAPAENLAGFTEAVKALSHKIDLASASGNDPAAIQHLEAAIAGLRGVMTHVASGDALAELAREVRALADRVERGPVADNSGFLNSLEQRIGAIAEALETRRLESGASSSPALEASIQALTRKIELLQSSHDSDVGQVENRINKLLDRFDASEAKFGRLDSIEHGMNELLGFLNEIRADQSAHAGPDPTVEALHRDVARTQDSLEAIHDTMSSMVGRLAMIETDIRREPARPTAPAPMAATEPASRVFVALDVKKTIDAAAAPTPAGETPPSLSVTPPSVTPRTQLESDLPADFPLEPGSGPPDLRRPLTSAAERIAASEAALPQDKSAATPADHASKQNFILAARRAAQAAAGERPAAGARIINKAAAESNESKLSQRMKSLFVGVSVIVVLAGVLRLAVTFLDPHDSETAAPQPHKASQSVPPSPIAAPAPSSPSAVPGFDIPPSSDKPFEAPVPHIAPRAVDRSSSLVPDDQSIFSVAPSSGALPVDTPAVKQPTADVTGSLGPRAPVSAPAPVVAGPIAVPPPAAAIAPPPKLPATIGGKALLNAAANGEAGAAYEVASRFADGRTVAINLEQAAIWFERAANAGLAPAQFRLGSLYEKGQGVKKDVRKARDLYFAAAEKGNAKAMHNLAVLYAEGFEGKPDYPAASQWFRKAAEHGVADSQYNLGVLYARGIGVAQNLSESFKWFSLAAQQGDQDAAKKRDDVATRLDAKTLEAAQQTVQDFVADAQPDEAINVNAPRDGWDPAPAPAKPKAKPRTSPKTVAL